LFFILPLHQPLANPTILANAGHFVPSDVDVCSAVG